MRKINKILIGIILITTIFLCIGYSAIQNITLDIKGTISAGPTTYLTPSELFDADGSDADALHIGDFVEYDAGTWTQNEINEIQVGPTSDLVIASGSTELPDTKFQFGGFEAGSSRNENATPYDSSYDYVKDASTGEGITGWRVFDIEDDGTITLISAGNPEDYYHESYETNSGYICEYILTGNINSNWNEEEASDYQIRDWSKYINTSQKATSATTLTYNRLNSWYIKYIGLNENEESLDDEFTRIYEEPYIKYQNIIDNYSYYWLSDSRYYDIDVSYVSPWFGGVFGSFSNCEAYGVRILITLSPDILLGNVGTKTITGGNMDTYGGDQTYNRWEIKVKLPSTDETTPYLPEGYIHVGDTDLDTGLVIEDVLGNQYVWVEVPRNSTVYSTAGLNITEFTDEEYNKIENDLHTYTTTYRNNTTFSDTYSGDDGTTGLTSSQYTELKKKMLKSVYTNGGFYVGRYETGIANSYRTESGTPTETPVVKANAYPYNYVTCSQAQTVASKLSTEGYISSMMFGVQWDLMLKYLESKGATQAELMTNSTAWGNYQSTTYNITNTIAKYSTDSCVSWKSAPYNKTSSSTIWLTTGSDNKFCKQNLYDLAGNVREWTLEYTNNSEQCANRGGSAGGDTFTPGYRTHLSKTTSSYAYGFRVSFYKDLGTGAEE